MVLGALGAILADAQERGLVSQNVVRGLRSRRLRGKERRADRRQRGKLRIGVDIPSPEQIRAIIAALEGRWRPLLLTAIFTGLRASELRGLRWTDVDLKRNELHVRQRADYYRQIGALKSEAGERTIPLAPMLINTLREWKLACPKGELGLVFPNEPVASRATPTSSTADSSRRRLPPASRQTAKRSTPACTACDTSMPVCASTVVLMVDSSCH
jgi:integrase